MKLSVVWRRLEISQSKLVRKEFPRCPVQRPGVHQRTPLFPGVRLPPHSAVKLPSVSIVCLRSLRYSFLADYCLFCEKFINSRRMFSDGRSELFDFSFPSCNFFQPWNVMWLLLWCNQDVLPLGNPEMNHSDFSLHICLFIFRHYK
jgi:hypothetical protein